MLGYRKYFWSDARRRWKKISCYCYQRSSRIMWTKKRYSFFVYFFLAPTHIFFLTFLEEFYYKLLALLFTTPIILDLEPWVSGYGVCCCSVKLYFASARMAIMETWLFEHMISITSYASNWLLFGLQKNYNILCCSGSNRILPNYWI